MSKIAELLTEAEKQAIRQLDKQIKEEHPELVKAIEEIERNRKIESIKETED